MEKHITLLNDYMSNFIVEANNLTNMGLNLKGESFFGLHRKLYEYKDMMDSISKRIGMRIKMIEGYPITSLKEIENISAIKSMQSRDYSGRQILEVLENDFKYLIDYTEDIVNYFINENDIYTKMILEENLKDLKPAYWMIKSSLI